MIFQKRLEDFRSLRQKGPAPEVPAPEFPIEEKEVFDESCPFPGETGEMKSFPKNSSLPDDTACARSATERAQAVSERNDSVTREKEKKEPPLPFTKMVLSSFDGGKDGFFVGG